MGKPAPVRRPRDGAGSYRDEPDNDAVSMHTTPDDYEYAEPEQPTGAPPTYEESIQADSDAVPERPGPDAFASVAEPERLKFGGTKTDTTIRIAPTSSIRMEERLNDPVELEKYIQEYLQYIPPNNMIRITGWHWETRKRDNKEEQNRVCDFDMVFSLRDFLPPHTAPQFFKPTVVPDTKKCHRGSWRKTRAPGVTQDLEITDEPPKPLHEWCEEFCASKAILKIFRVSREISGFNEHLARERIYNAIRATQYRGHVDVSFPISDKNVDIYNPHWINRARISWVRWIFYVTFLWIITWPILFFMTMRWDVYNVEWVWSFVNPPPNNTIRYCWRLTEGMWVDQYQHLIKKLAVERFQGDATQIGWAVSPQAWQESMVVNSGNSNVDAAVNLVRGGVDVWNALNGRPSQRPGNGSGWGLDVRV